MGRDLNAILINRYRWDCHEETTRSRVHSTAADRFNELWVSPFSFFAGHRADSRLSRAC